MSEQDKALDNLMAWQQELDKQEPVAWMQTFVNQDGDEKNFSLSLERIGVNDIPLYTAPRELSTDEIFDIWDEHTDYDGNFITDIDTFVRAILKKASEK